jgi:tetratricopeptide (TPR) repeat protein
VTGLVVDATGFEVLAGGERVGPRRVTGPGDLALLAGLEQRYVRAVQAHADPAVFAGLGRELSDWLDGDLGQLTGLLEQAGAPLVFEIQGPRAPSPGAWAVLRAPWELLARPGGGLLAEDVLARFTVVRRLGVRQAKPALDGFRLGLAFMASAPHGQRELDFEAEEAAILAAAGQTRLDLLVDDTGDPVQLAGRLAGPDGMPVVHLSCHGLNNWQPPSGGEPEPVLMMEDETGAGRPATAGDLAGLLPAGVRLLFVSACLTATGADAPQLPPGKDHKRDPAAGARGGDGGGLVAHSLATALVTAGVPAVLGWDGSVEDRAATVFAGRLYQDLANGADLELAVGDARRALLTSQDPIVRADWHLARLWLGPVGGGPVAVAGGRKRSLITATHGTKIFLDRKQQVPVAAPEMFVGRRPELQQALRALRSGKKAGALLHGQGRLGKSSLAARIADRSPDYAVAVVFGDYSPLAILDAIAVAVATDKKARDLVEERLPDVRQLPEALEDVLTDLLAGPCAQAGEDGQRPLLLILDDLEQILTPDPDGPHQVAPAYAGVLAAVMRAFDPARSDSRLLVTSRYTFTLSGLETRLEDVQLRPLSPVARVKLQRRQQALTPVGPQAERTELAARAVAVSRGNPGLQDLTVLRLVYSDQVSAERAEAAVSGIEAYLSQGDLPGDADVRPFVENLALDALLDEAGASGRALLRAATLFSLPVPEPVINALASQVGGSPARLCGLGLLDPYPDLYTPGRTALAASPLAAGRLEPVSPAEQAELAAICAPVLLAAWGGPAPEPGRGIGLDLQLARLALAAGDPDVAAASAAGAVAALGAGPAAGAMRLGQDVISLLDRNGDVVPLLLLRRAAAAAITAGHGDTGHTLLTRAVQQAETSDVAESSPLDLARVIAEHGRHLITRGDLDQAGQLLARARQLFIVGGSELESMVVAGTIAGIAYQRGDYDEALRVYREETLPVFERLGDTREIAVTWSSVADMAYQRGDYDEALRILREETLPVFERLGETRSAAITWGKIADIAYQRGDYDEALRIRREETLPVFERLGATRETAVTWSQIADIAYQRGDYDEALRIRREETLPVYERLGATREIAIAWGSIADIAYQRGDYNEALRIRREVELPAYERLGATRETAVTWGQIADIAYQKGDLNEAAELNSKRLEVNTQLGDLDGIAAASWDLARIDLTREDHESALPRLAESFQILTRLERPDGIALVGTALGRLLAAAGHADQARQVLSDALAAATKIGHTEVIEEISQLLTTLPPQNEEET